MSSSVQNLEIKGGLLEHPFAELLVEAESSKLTGSFRLSRDAQKIIVYVKSGKVAFAVSNSRSSRLFEILLQSGKITKDFLSENPNFTNDLEFGAIVAAKGIMTEEEVKYLFSRQIEAIIKTVLSWQTGEWIFSLFARIKESIAFEVNIKKLLIEYARNMPNAAIVRRFRSFEEVFVPKDSVNTLGLDLLTPEAFLLTRFEDKPLNVQEAQSLSGLSDTDTLKNLYILWLGDLITRRKWNSAFTAAKLEAINTAKLTLKKETDVPVNSAVRIPAANKPEENLPEVAVAENSAVQARNDEKQILKAYLKRVESAESYYEMLEIPFEASISDIKTAYFALAKNFHPDRFHQETDATLRHQIQESFTEIARAYETLKSPETKQVYDIKLRKHFEMTGAKQENVNRQNLTDEDKAGEEFEQGFSLLMNERYDEALPFIIRAVQMAPNNARFHAYYGKVLSFDEKQRYKAESEMQTAIRLDPNNPTYRMLAAEFYTQFGLLKRAEGELQRLLSLFPGNREAQIMLDSLAKK